MKKHISVFVLLIISTIGLNAQIIPSNIPSDGLIGWWPFNGNAIDESGNGNNGTVNGAILSTDRSGAANSAYSFDGVDDFINTGFVNEISGSSQLTISYWINSPLNFPFNPAGNYGTVIGHWKNDGDFPGSPIGYQDAIFNDGTYTSSLLGAQGAFSTPNIIQQNIWQNITIVFNGLLNANERVSLYLNGNFVQFINVNNVPSQIGSTATRTYIGAACGPDGDDDAWSHFNGTIDDIGIWNRALTANEIQNLYNLDFNNSTCNPLPSNLQNGLVGYWPFCGNANDESGNGNNGTVNGATPTSNRFNEPNGAYEFDGNNDFISIPHSQSLNNSSEITVNCWILLQNSSTYNNIISKDNDAFGDRSWFFGVNEDRIITATFNPNQNNFEIVSPNFNFIQNWSMVSFTIGSDSLRLYVDGEEVLSAFYYSPLQQIIEPVKIGVMDETNGANWFFDGKIDDVGIWNRALTADEIQTLFSNSVCNNILAQNDFSSCPNTSHILNFNNSADTLTTYNIGDTGPSGGIIFYDKGNNNDGWRYLEAATSDLNQATWGCNGVVLQNTIGIAIGTGLENTNNIVAQCTENNIAAKLCFDFTSNGYDDWFLPSRDELFQLYLNRALVGGFNPSGYWTSTQQPVPFPLPDYAYFQSFEDVPVCCNGLYNTGKNQLLRVRPIRRVSELSFPTYLWSTGETTPSITVSPTETTTYTLTVSQGPETCTDQVTVTVLPSPTVEITSNSPVIAGANLELNASANSGTTFLWTGPNNFTSTEQNPIVTNTSAFNAGIYSVTPTLNGCLGETVSLNTEIIPSDNVLTLYMDTVAGINGQETLVNMRVRNFTNMLSAQFTLQFDPSVVSYSGFTNPAITSITGNSFGQTQIANGILTFAWNQPNVTPVTLNDGTVLFSLRFQVVGDGGSSTPIQFLNSPTPLEFVDQSFIPLNSWIVNPGRIEVLNLSTISGNLKLPNGIGIRSATIAATGYSNQSVQSALDGSYSINLPEGQQYTITPTKGNDTLATNGITTLDVILIQRHILGILLLNSPYKIIAADVNLSGTVTSADINLINALILANIDQYPSGKFWSFILDDYSFPTQTNPFPFPSSRVYPSVSSTVNEDYWGVKLGDVNFTYNNSLARLSQSTDSVNLYIDNQNVMEESTIKVPIRVKNFNNMAGFQLALNWNPQVLSFSEINPADDGLTINIGSSQATNGLLNVNWIEPNASIASIADDSALFVVTFNVIGAIGSNSDVNIVSSSTTPIELINENLEVTSFGIQSGNILVNTPSSINSDLDKSFRIYPNPANQFIHINCENCLENNGFLMNIYNTLGQCVYQYQLDSFPATIPFVNKLSSGLYFMVIEDEKKENRLVRKIQISDK